VGIAHQMFDRRLAVPPSSVVGGQCPPYLNDGRLMSDSPETSKSESDGSSDTAPSKEASVSFAQAAEEKQPGLLREFAEFLIESKAWWLTPIIIVLLLVGLLVVLSGSVVAPFIYPIF
jgi:hypothetical protein